MEFCRGKNKSQACADDPAETEELPATTAVAIEVSGKQPQVLWKYRSPAALD